MPRKDFSQIAPRRGAPGYGRNAEAAAKALKGNRAQGDDQGRGQEDGEEGLDRLMPGRSR
jgi:hypothetical protein